jgi:site-specific recombinase XerD
VPGWVCPSRDPLFADIAVGRSQAFPGVPGYSEPSPGESMKLPDSAILSTQVAPRFFADFMADRGTRKPSPHTLKAYRQDFDAIASIIAGATTRPCVSLSDITTEMMRRAFALYAQAHEASSIRRCWSTWNALCAFLYTSGQIDANPMPLVGRPKVGKSLPKALPPKSVAALLATVELVGSTCPRRQTDWVERDRAIILTALLAGLRADELIRADVGDIRRTQDGAIVEIRGKGGKDRRVPVENSLVEILECYLLSRSIRFPGTATAIRSAADHLAAWRSNTALFVGTDGNRITRGTLQYRVLRAFRRAGIESERPRGALVHGLRHTFATELANADVSVYILMNLLGHESMTTSQRYVSAAGTATRAAAAQNGLYKLL